MSMQFEDEVVQVRADAHDHLAHDMDVVTVLRVDGAISGRAGREEEARGRARRC